MALFGAMVLAGGIASLSGASAGQSPAAEASAFFATSCLKTPPSFASISQLAAHGGYRLFQDRKIGPAARQKEWLVPVAPKTPPLLLSVIHGPSADGSATITVCGVSVLGASGSGLQRALSANPQLGHPVKVGTTQGGGTQIVWSARFGRAVDVRNARVVLAYGVPGMQADPINLILKRPK